MAFSIGNFTSLPENVKLAFQDLEAWLTTFLLKEHNSDGTHGAREGAGGGSGAGAVSAFETAGRWWRGEAAWLLDDPASSTPHVVGIRPPDLPAGTYHNFAPQGIDTAVLIELEPEGAVIITGIKIANLAQKRLMAIRNRDSEYTVTLAHGDTGSLEPYRFDLPNSEDIVLGPRQGAWMYYDPGRKALCLFVTPHQSGGLATMIVEGDLRVEHLAISSAQLDALNATAVQIVAAPGAGKIAIPLNWSAATYRGDSTAWSAAPNYRLRYTGDTAPLCADLASQLNAGGFTPPKRNFHTAAHTTQLLGFADGTFDPENKAIEVVFTADTNPGGVASADVSVAYYIKSR